jgi:hypothetical protein
VFCRSRPRIQPSVIRTVISLSGGSAARDARDAHGSAVPGPRGRHEACRQGGRFGMTTRLHERTLMETLTAAEAGPKCGIYKTRNTHRRDPAHAGGSRSRLLSPRRFPT